MTRRQSIIRMLFTMSCISIHPALADEPKETPGDDLVLIEELPPEQRTIAHEAVMNYLEEHPEDAPAAKVIAVDKNGVVYGLDEEKTTLTRVGQPSCYAH